MPRRGAFPWAGFSDLECRESQPGKLANVNRLADIYPIIGNHEESGRNPPTF
jgi:hypothetical protein